MSQEALVQDTLSIGIRHRPENVLDDYEAYRTAGGRARKEDYERVMDWIHSLPPETERKSANPIQPANRERYTYGVYTEAGGRLNKQWFNTAMAFLELFPRISEESNLTYADYLAEKGMRGKKNYRRLVALVLLQKGSRQESIRVSLEAEDFRWTEGAWGFISRAESLAGAARVSLTEKQKCLYAFLRGQWKGEVGEGSVYRDGSQNQTDGDEIRERNRPEQLYDQEILIEVARLTGDEKGLGRLTWEYLDQKANTRWNI